MVTLSGLNIDVVPGSFLLAQFPEFQGRLIVCEVVEVVSPTNIVVCQWLEDDLLHSLISNDSREPLLESIYENVVKCRIKEVTKVAPVQISLQSTQVHDIAFVFHAFGVYLCQLCRHESRFFTRYKLDIGGLREINYEQHQPFSIGQECYHSRIWYTLHYVKDKMTQMMNKRRQQQLCRNSSNIFLSQEAWQYLCRKFSPVVIAHSFTKNKTKPHQFCDLSLEMCTSRATYCMLRICTPDSMDRAREVFGTTFGIGCRNLPPLKGEPRRQLVHGDISSMFLIIISKNC